MVKRCGIEDLCYGHCFLCNATEEYDQYQVYMKMKILYFCMDSMIYGSKKY